MSLRSSTVSHHHSLSPPTASSTTPCGHGAPTPCLADPSPDLPSRFLHLVARTSIARLVAPRQRGVRNPLPALAAPCLPVAPFSDAPNRPRLLYSPSGCVCTRFHDHATLDVTPTTAHRYRCRSVAVDRPSATAHGPPPLLDPRRQSCM